MQNELPFLPPSDDFEPHQEYVPMRAAERQPKFFVPFPYCVYCGIDTTVRSRQKDHIQPSSRDGDDSEKNTARSCACCNHKKSDKDSDVFRSEQMAAQIRELRRLMSDERVRIERDTSHICSLASKGKREFAVELMDLTDGMKIDSTMICRARRLIATIICLSSDVEASPDISLFLPNRFIPEHEIPDWYIEFIIRVLIFHQCCTYDDLFMIGRHDQFVWSDALMSDVNSDGLLVQLGPTKFLLMRHFIFDKNATAKFWGPCHFVMADEFSAKSIIRLELKGDEALCQSLHSDQGFCAILNQRTGLLALQLKKTLFFPNPTADKIAVRLAILDEHSGPYEEHKFWPPKSYWGRS